MYLHFEFIEYKINKCMKKKISELINKINNIIKNIDVYIDN